MRARERNPDAGPRAPRAAPRPAGHPLLGLQRVVGNRATAAAIHLARQVGHDPLPPPPLPQWEWRPVARSLQERGAKPGESSPQVLRLQVLLNTRLGDRVLHADGVYGPKTEEQVFLFQLSKQRQPPAPPGPNPLPPPPPPPEPGPIPRGLEPTGDADPATVEALEAAVSLEQGIDLADADCAAEALTLVRDKRKSLRLSLLSAARNAERLIDADDIWDEFPGSEFDYWDAVAQHANWNFARAQKLYEQILEEPDEGDWDGIKENCQFQLDRLDRGKAPEVEPHPDPNLEENSPT